MAHVIRVAQDFSMLPAGRYKTDGNYTGQHFRELLKAALSKGDVQVDFDGVLGVGSSFLEESFGGLVRDNIVTGDDLGKRIHITSNDHPEVIEKIQRYMQAV